MRDVESDFTKIRQLIEDAIEHLDDLIFTLLREASQESTGRPASDKTLVQARRALEKASRLLGDVGS